MANKGACRQVWRPESNPQDPPGGRREKTPANRPLTTTTPSMPWHLCPPPLSFLSSPHSHQALCSLDSFVSTFNDISKHGKGLKECFSEFSTANCDQWHSADDSFQFPLPGDGPSLTEELTQRPGRNPACCLHHRLNANV